MIILRFPDFWTSPVEIGNTVRTGFYRFVAVLVNSLLLVVAYRSVHQLAFFLAAAQETWRVVRLAVHLAESCTQLCFSQLCS